MAAGGDIIMKPILIVAAALLLLACPLHALTGVELKQMLSDNAAITLVDIRSKVRYQAGHIQGAINIPFTVLPHKRLPRLGDVIVYGDGIRENVTGDALKILNEKDGIDAQMLDGGYAAWEALSYNTTAAKGIRKQQIAQVTYADLQEMTQAAAGIILVDLRPHSESMSDLSENFSGAEIIKIGTRRIKRKGLDPDRLYVLVDGGSGRSDTTAVHLKSLGIKRVAVLTGGELSISNKGASRMKVNITKGNIK